MGKIFYIMGKSASGKDSIYEHLLEDRELGLKKIILYTTRPIRAGEQDGREYFFVDRERLDSLREAGRIIECRDYQTVHGIWSYFTADDGQISPDQSNYVGIGTLESYRKLREYFGPETVVPLYVEVEDGERLARALRRENKQEQPKYAEMCRRFLADQEDFSEENLRAAGIEKRYHNDDLKICLSEIKKDIYNSFNL